MYTTHCKLFPSILTLYKAIDKIASVELQQQIEDFADGKETRDVLQDKPFRVDVHKSPPVQHHFSLIEELKKLFVCSIDLKAAVNDVLHPKHKHVKNLPIIYEDKSNTRLVEVSILFPFQHHIPLFLIF